jgi:hypothetical protein
VSSRELGNFNCVRLFLRRIYQPKTGMILMWPSAAKIRDLVDDES